MEKQYCPICDTKMTHETDRTRTVKYKTPNGLTDITLTGLSFYICEKCSEGVYGPTDLKLYNLKLNEYHDKRRREKKLLTADEIKFIRENTDLSQAELEKILGLGEKSFTRWENNKVDQSKSVDWLLRIIHKYGINFLKDVDEDTYLQSSK